MSAEPTLPKERRKAEGVCFTGVGACRAPGFVLVAPNLAELALLWRLITKEPLNLALTYPVAVFHQNDTKEIV